MIAVFHDDLSPTALALLKRRPELLDLYTDLDEEAIAAEFRSLPPADLPPLMRHIEAAQKMAVDTAQRNRGDA